MRKLDDRRANLDYVVISPGEADELIIERGRELIEREDEKEKSGPKSKDRTR